MATTDLKLEEPGSLPKPGPVGRAVRLLFGLLCLWYVSELLAVAANLIASNGNVLPLMGEDAGDSQCCSSRRRCICWLPVIGHCRDEPVRAGSVDLGAVSVFPPGPLVRSFRRHRNARLRDAGASRSLLEDHGKANERALLPCRATPPD